VEAAQDASGKSPALVIERGSKIIADCTRELPCTFTTNVVEDLPTHGLWGGLVICGSAPTQNMNSGQVEGLEGSFFGGTNPADNSGIVRYVRIWYGGHQLGDGHHVSAITFAGVGTGTTVEYLEVAYSEDNGVEFFGGTVHAKYISIVYAKYNGIDFTMGYMGKIQYVFILVDSAGDHGIEVSSDPTEHAFNSLPRTHPKVRSVTILGHPQNSNHSMIDVTSAAGGSFKHILLNGNMGFENTHCHSEEITQSVPTFDTDYLYVSPYNVFQNNSDVYMMAEADSACYLKANITLQYYPAVFSTHQVLVTYASKKEREGEQRNYESGLFRKVPADCSSPLNASVLDPRLTKEAKMAFQGLLATVTSDGDTDTSGFFETTTYVGAFDAVARWMVVARCEREA